MDRVSTMDALLFAISLEVSLQQLSVLENYARHNALDYGDTTTSESLQLEKLMKDRFVVNDSVRRTITELVESGTWTSLINIVAMLQQKNVHLVTLLKHNDDLKTSLKNNRLELSEIRQKCSLDIREKDREIAVMLDESKDAVLNTTIRLSYADKWLSSRAESLEMQNRNERTLTPCLDHENHAHDQVVQIYELQIKERLDSLDYWQTRYINDIDKINKEVSDIREKWKEVVNRRMDMQKLYDLHAGEMRDWVSFKRERVARLAHEEELRVAATRLQAWWRGVMVRRCLGIYRHLKNAKKSNNKQKKK